MIEEMIHDEANCSDTDSESLQSHELAHQWFGDYVTVRTVGPDLAPTGRLPAYLPQAMWTD